ncbi:MAG: 4-hydroxy-tetrahydrodipicolinate synthase [Parachlamydiales bacterium]
MRGVYTAMITPFDGEGRLDRTGLVANLEEQLAADVDGVVVLATTGESAALTAEEQQEIIAIAVEVAGGRIDVVVGAGSNSTEETVAKVKRAKELGADCALVVVPYYNKPTQKGLFTHFERVAEEGDFPIILYNNPSRCGVNLEPLTVRQLARVPNIVGLKECYGEQASEILESVADGFSFFAGNDTDALPLMALGAVGVISPLANLAPRAMCDLVDAMERGDLDEARQIHFGLFPVMKGLSFEPNPIPVKEAMRLCGKPAGDPRPPLHRLSEAHHFALRQLLVDAGLAGAAV